MKTKMMLLVAISMMALSGCGSMHTAATATKAAPLATQDDIDWERVDKINREARLEGVLVQWLHFPRKHDAVKGN